MKKVFIQTITAKWFSRICQTKRHSSLAQL